MLAAGGVRSDADLDDLAALGLEGPPLAPRPYGAMPTTVAALGPNTEPVVTYGVLS